VREFFEYHRPEALDYGHSWHDIARALPTSLDQACLHYDRESPVADGRWPNDC
jgi:hypothetical protein